MKRLAAFGLCVALCISLTACRFVDLEPEELVEVLPLLCDPDLEKVKREIRARVRTK